MGPWPDHLRCPSLRRWVPDAVEGSTTAYWIAERRRGWRPPRALTRWLQRWPAADLPESADSPAWLESPRRTLIVVRPLGDDDGLEGLLASLRGDQEVIEVATPPSLGLPGLVRPLWRRRVATQHAALRMRWWLIHGAGPVQQWVCSDPVDGVVTRAKIGRRWVRTVSRLRDGDLPVPT